MSEAALRADGQPPHVAVAIKETVLNHLLQPHFKANAEEFMSKRVSLAGRFAAITCVLWFASGCQTLSLVGSTQDAIQARVSRLEFAMSRSMDFKPVVVDVTTTKYYLTDPEWSMSFTVCYDDMRKKNVLQVITYEGSLLGHHKYFIRDHGSNGWGLGKGDDYSEFKNGMAPFGMIDTSDAGIEQANHEYLKILNRACGRLLE